MFINTINVIYVVIVIVVVSLKMVHPVSAENKIFNQINLKA
jgi:hypothetical protein